MLPSGPALLSPDTAAYFSVNFIPDAPAKADYQVTRLLLDSRDFTRQDDPTLFAGSFDLNSIGHGMFQNVVACELKGLGFPKVAGERYVVLDIPTLNDENLSATNSTSDRSFAVCYFDSDLLLPGQVKPQKGADFYQKTIKFRPAINKLDHIDVNFRKWDGNVVSSSDVAGTGNVQFSMILELTTIANRRW